jgi:prepilin-type processing-associated H-X9-DG protein
MDDVHVRIHHGTPERLVIQKMGSAGYTDNAIFYRGEQLIADSSHNTGASFLLTGGLTNYGINAQVGRVEVAPRTVVLLDYDMQAANNGEDQGVHLQASRRHLGKLNVLFADESVRRLGPSELDPTVSQDAVELWSPQ